jgi:glycerophosphoryl diester phosphodiesterase
MLRKRKGVLAATATLLAGAYAIRRRSGPSPTRPPFFAARDVLAIAHRGGGGNWPQNTIYAFEQAVSLGVDVLETDIHSTADGVLVVMHDHVVDNVTDGSGPIRSFTLKELKKLDAGYRWTVDGGRTFPFRGQGLQIPTLQEVLEAFPDTPLNIDIKPRELTIVEPFCRMLHDYDRLQTVVIGSFNDDQLNHFRKLCPQVATAAGVTETRMFYDLQRVGLARLYRPRAAAFQLPEYAEGQRLITPDFIHDAHRVGMDVHVWTVDEKASMRRLIDWGVDGLMSDYPDRLLEVLQEKTE